MTLLPAPPLLPPLNPNGVPCHLACWPADKVESALQERARLGYTAAVAREMMQTTKSAVQRLRFALAATGLASGVANSARYLGKERGGRPDPREVPGT
jgi:hypothetical protein